MTARQILIVCDCYFPVLKSISYLIRDLAHAFKAAGFAPVIITTDTTLKENSRVDVEEGITVMRVQSGNVKKATYLLRGLREARLSSRMLAAIEAHPNVVNPSLIVFYSPSIFLAGMVATLKQRFVCQAYLVLRDIFPDWAIDTKIIRNPLIAWFLKRQSKKQYEIADRIGVQSAGDLKLFTTGRHSAFRKKTELLRNWRSPQPEHASPRDVRAELGVTEKVLFLLGGSMGPAQEPDRFLDLARDLTPHPEVHFLLIGGGLMWHQLRGKVSHEGLKNVTLLDEMPFADYATYLKAADVGVVLLAPDLVTDNVPGRMMDYMQFELPILAIVNAGSELLNLVPEQKIGIATRADQRQATKAAAMRLAASASLRKAMGRNGPTALAHLFDPQVATRQILASTGDQALNFGAQPSNSAVTSGSVKRSA